MSRLANPAIRGEVAERLGLSVDEVAAMAITDPAASVQDDIERLHRTPGAPSQLVVSGFVYDVKNGTINQVVHTWRAGKMKSQSGSFSALAQNCVTASAPRDGRSI